MRHIQWSTGCGTFGGPPRAHFPMHEDVTSGGPLVGNQWTTGCDTLKKEQTNKTKQNEKNTFLKQFFNETWIKLGDHEYINIADIKFG